MSNPRNGTHHRDLRFEVADLERHRAITALAGSRAHGRLVLSLSRVLASEDAYRFSLWGLEPEAATKPKRLTHPAFNATSGELDPGGKRLAFLSQRGTDRKQVHVMRLDGGESVPVTTTRHALDAVSEWSPDGRQLLVTAKVRWPDDLGGDEAQDDDGANDPQRPKVARFLPYKSDGSGIVLGRRTHLFAVGVDDGKMTALAEGDFDVDTAHWSPDGAQLAFLRGRQCRQRHRNDLWLADADGSNSRQVTDALASIKHASWSPDGRWIALAAGREEGDSATYLFLLEVETGKLRKLGGEDFELAAAGAPRWHADGTRLAAVCMQSGLQRIAVLDVSVDAAPRILGSALSHATALASCGDRLACVVATLRKPDEVHTIAWDGSDERRRTAFNRGWMRARKRPHVAKRQFEAPDGAGGNERIDAWLLKPHGDGPFPVLVDLHGGPHSHVLLDLPAHVYWYLLVSRGWMVVAPNAVGSSGYGRRFRERLRGKWGELDLPQVIAVVEALQQAGLADGRIACAGKSYGGFLGAWAIGHCDTFRAAVVSAPVSDVESHAGTSDSGYYVTPWMMGGELHDHRERYHHLSPTAYCHEVNTPALLLQGAEDGRCPLGQTEELFAGLVRCSRVETEMVVYPGGSHGMAKSGKPSHRRDYHQRIVDWVERHANQP